VLYPYFDRHLRSWTITPGEDGGFNVTHNHNLWETLAQVLEVDEVTVLTTDEDIRAAEREQWDDGTNYLAVAPGSSSATTATSRRTRCCASTASRS
jgi:arginine deiminase